MSKRVDDGTEPLLAIFDMWIADWADPLWAYMTPEEVQRWQKQQDSLMAEARQATEQRDFERVWSLVRKPMRLGMLADWWQAGCLAPDELRAQLPGVWSGAEPDDTEELWFDLWSEAHAACGRIEEAPLPEDDVLTVYRGEPAPPEGSPEGIAWSLDRDVAVFFALRLPRSDGTGVVLEGTVARVAVMGYITDRKEAEVIVDPLMVTLTGMVPVTEADRPARREQT